AWNPDDQRYAFGYNDGRVRVFRRGEHRPVLQRTIMRHQIDEVSYTPDGRRLVAVDYNGNVTMVDAATLRPFGHQVHLPKTLGWEVSAGPNDHTAFVTGSAPLNPNIGWQDPQDRWWLVDLGDGKVLEQGHLGFPALYTAFSPRGDRAAVGGAGGKV